MKISILIVTRGRAELLFKALQTLKAASKKALPLTEFEFIVAINGADPETAQALRTLPEIIILQLSGANPGAARNEVLKAASGEWIYFADDDITVDEDFFTQFIEISRSKRTFDVLGGPNLTPGDSSAFQHASGLALSSPLASFRSADRYRRGQTEELCDDSKLILCNLFVRKTLALTLPFPNTYVCAEENFALAGWRKSGAKFLYDPRLSVYHQRRGTRGSFFKQVIKYGRGRGRLIAIGEFKWFHVFPSIAALLVVCLMIGSFTSAFALDILFSLLTLYGITLFIESLRLKAHSREVSVRDVALSILLIHFGYAAGVAHGALIDHRIAGSEADHSLFQLSRIRAENE